MSGDANSVRRGLDWGRLAPLRLRARALADGLYAGSHRSPRRGAGIEFAGHRNYVPGDDLRWLDRAAMLRHDRLYIRELEMDTDRALRLVLDASGSMAYRSERAPGAKLAYASLLAAALGRIAIAAGDPVGLDWFGGEKVLPLPTTGGVEAFERLVAYLEAATPAGDLSTDGASIDRALTPLMKARRGTLVVAFSDLLDIPDSTRQRLVAVGARGRRLVMVQVLDPREADFDFDGPVRLRSLEGGVVVETDAVASRESYLGALRELQGDWRKELLRTGGRLVLCTSAEDPVAVLRRILAAFGGGP